MLAAATCPPCYGEFVDLAEIPVPQSFPHVPDVPIFDPAAAAAAAAPRCCAHPFTRVSNPYQCFDCRAHLDAEQHAARRASEDARAAAARREDQATCSAGADAHAALVHSCGVSVEWLVAFTEHHNCWDWPTWRVNRLIIKPATMHTRCRYAHLPEMAPHVGLANVFLSHCWGAPFGDVVMAALTGAKRNGRYVWLDLFAVRQWPGREADLCFEHVVRRCGCVLVSVTVVDALNPPQDPDARAWIDGIRAGYRTEAQQAVIRRTVSLCRLWCIVEMAAAVRLCLPLVLRYGAAVRDGSERHYISGPVGLQLIQFLVEEPPVVQDAACSTETDRREHLARIEAQPGGHAEMNRVLQRALMSALHASQRCCRAVESALCGEHGALESLLRRCGCPGGGGADHADHADHADAAAVDADAVGDVDLRPIVNALRVALLSRQDALFAELLDRMGDEMLARLNASDGDFRNLVWDAAQLDSVDACRLLLERGKIDTKQYGGRHGESALSLAVRSNSADMVQLLIKHGASFEEEAEWAAMIGPRWYYPSTLYEVWEILRQGGDFECITAEEQIVQMNLHHQRQVEAMYASAAAAQAGEEKDVDAEQDDSDSGDPGAV